MSAGLALLPAKVSEALGYCTRKVDEEVELSLAEDTREFRTRDDVDAVVVEGPHARLERGPKIVIRDCDHV
jgi:hypothetical protein